MIAQFFLAELSTLQLPDWLMIAGGVLVIVGAVGALVSSRRSREKQPNCESRSLIHDRTTGVVLSFIGQPPVRCRENHFRKQNLKLI